MISTFSLILIPQVPPFQPDQILAGLFHCHWSSNMIALVIMKTPHSEISPITQTTPEPTLLTWGVWPLKKIPPPWSCCQTRSYHAYLATQTPLSLEPFDTLWYSGVPWMPNLLKISLDIESDFRNAFTAHCTQIWMLNRISITIISQVARKCICCCHRVHRCVTVPPVGGNCAVER